MFWSESKPARTNSATHSRTAHFEQAELWTAKPAARASAVVRESAVAVRSEAQSPALTRSVVRTAARAVPAGKTYAERQQRARPEDMARLLEANRMVYGELVPVRAFSLPRRSFSAALNLWKGSELGTPFVTGC